MSDRGPKNILARVQAKDEDVTVSLQVNANTTLGELTRYWDWKERLGEKPKGFIIDLTPDHSSTDIEAETYSEGGSLTWTDLNFDISTLSFQNDEDPETEQESSAMSLRSEANSAAESAPLEEKTSCIPAGFGGGAAENPTPVDDKGARDMREFSNGSDRDNNDAFEITVAHLERSLRFLIRPRTSVKKICQAACAQFEVEFASLRFVFEGDRIKFPPRSAGELETDHMYNGESKIMLIRDPTAQYVTAEDWGMKEGSRIDALLCQCGC